MKLQLSFTVLIFSVLMSFWINQTSTCCWRCSDEPGGRPPPPSPGGGPVRVLSQHVNDERPFYQTWRDNKNIYQSIINERKEWLSITTHKYSECVCFDQPAVTLKNTCPGWGQWTQHESTCLLSVTSSGGDLAPPSVWPRPRPLYFLLWCRRSVKCWVLKAYSSDWNSESSSSCFCVETVWWSKSDSVELQTVSGTFTFSSPPLIPPSVQQQTFLF